MHPLHRESFVPDVDVIIVHGLLGSVHSTWRQRIWDIPTNLGLGGIVNGNIDGESVPGTCVFSSTQLLEIDDPDEDLLEDEYEFVLADIPESESEPAITDLYTIPCSDPQIKSTCKCIHLSQCWPKDWLPKDHTRIKLLGVDYLSRITDWTNWCPFRHSEEKAKLAERSRAIMGQLLECGLGNRPIVWIGHSMGGLIIKHILTQALEENTIEHERLVKNTKHVFFLGTPHLGSPIASIRKYLVPFLPSVETRELELNSPELLILHNKFCDLVKRLGTKVVTFLETKGTKLSVPPLEWELSCVAPIPSDIGTGVIYNIPVGHMDIAKLSTRMSFIYMKILDAIKQAGPNSDNQRLFLMNSGHEDATRGEHDNIDQNANKQKCTGEPTMPDRTTDGEKSNLNRKEHQENTFEASKAQINEKLEIKEDNITNDNDKATGKVDNEDHGNMIDDSVTGRQTSTL